MMILAPRKVIGFENSVNSGGIPYALLLEKYQKSPAKLIYSHTIMETLSHFLLKFRAFFMGNHFSNTKPLKAISIATS